MYTIYMHTSPSYEYFFYIDTIAFSYEWTFIYITHKLRTKTEEKQKNFDGFPNLFCL